MLYKTYESFNNQDNKIILDTAWLYFLHYVYNGKMKISSWKKDNRIGVVCHDSMLRLQYKKLVIIEDDYYISVNNSEEVINKIFGANSIKEAFDRSIDLLSYKTKSYNTNNIPIDLYLRINEDFEDLLYKWDEDFFVNWFNLNGADKVLNSWFKKNCKENTNKINDYKLRRYYYPNKLPENITLYRGIKKKYDSNHNKKYTSWTLDLKEAKRFATYNFSKGFSASPNISDEQYLLTVNVKLKDIIMFIGGDESEVILKEPVKHDDIIDLKKST